MKQASIILLVAFSSLVHADLGGSVTNSVPEETKAQACARAKSDAQRQAEKNRLFEDMSGKRNVRIDVKGCECSQNNSKLWVCEASWSLTIQ